MKRTLLSAKPLVGFALLAASLFTACSGGGGGSSPAPVASPVLGGIGPNITFDQKVNFTVIVPPASTTSALAAARRKRLGTTSAATTNPYISPNTASITLQIGTVNGQSPRLLPPIQTFAVSCPGTSGCSVPIQNIAAAKGVDRFAVQTFSGPGATGNLISSAFIDVTVPSAQATSFGGTALTVGGFVGSISLALNIPGGTFRYSSPGTATLDVNAMDTAGAIIIGSDQLATAITVSLPTPNPLALTSPDPTEFTINSAQQVALQQPAQTLTLAYDGASRLSGVVTASTTDENNQPVATSVPIPVSTPTPTPRPATPVPPTPTPVPSQKPPLSLYVYDAAGDRILEYSGIDDFEGGKSLSTTPRRVFEIAPPAALSANVSYCTAGQPFITSMAVSVAGTIFVQSTCVDTQTSLINYVFSYPASTQEAIVPQASPTPPVPGSTIAVSPGFMNPVPASIKLDESHGTMFLEYINSQFTSPYVIGLPLPSGGSPTTNIGSTCLQEIGFNQSCASNPYYTYQTVSNFAVDGSGHLVVPTVYQGVDGNGNPITPIGNPAVQFPSEPALVLLNAGTNDPAPTPVSALAGAPDDLGSEIGLTTSSVAFEGNTVYTLTDPLGPNTDPNNSGAQVYSGLSSCPAPAPSVVPDSATNLCADGAAHEYIAAFPNLVQSLTASAAAGTNLVMAPSFMVGGDVVGNFGTGTISTGDPLVVKDGYAYVLNTGPIGGGQTEIDVYNLNNVAGYHTDIAPQAKILLDPSIAPTTIAVGATGTGIGGQAILRRPARVHHDVKAWRRQMMLKQLGQHKLPQSFRLSR